MFFPIRILIVLLLLAAVIALAAQGMVAGAGAARAAVSVFDCCDYLVDRRLLRGVRRRHTGNGVVPWRPVPCVFPVQHSDARAVGGVLFLPPQG